MLECVASILNYFFWFMSFTLFFWGGLFLGKINQSVKQGNLFIATVVEGFSCCVPRYASWNRNICENEILIDALYLVRSPLVVFKLDPCHTSFCSLYKLPGRKNCCKFRMEYSDWSGSSARARAGRRMRLRWLFEPVLFTFDRISLTNRRRLTVYKLTEHFIRYLLDLSSLFT